MKCLETLIKPGCNSLYISKYICEKYLILTIFIYILQPEIQRRNWFVYLLHAESVVKCWSLYLLSNCQFWIFHGMALLLFFLPRLTAKWSSNLVAEEFCSYGWNIYINRALFSLQPRKSTAYSHSSIFGLDCEWGDILITFIS